MFNNISQIEWMVYGSVVLIMLIYLYRGIVYNYTKYKYRTCPKCGSETITNHVEEYTFADIETWEEITCTNLDCDFKHKHKFME